MLHLQGAGGRRCELEGSTWEVGSSDGAVPEPMGLSVVILLGWPRSVRVMVVGTFKPERQRGSLWSQSPLSVEVFPSWSFFSTEHTPSASPQAGPTVPGQSI